MTEVSAATTESVLGKRPASEVAPPEAKPPTDAPVDTDASTPAPGDPRARPAAVASSLVSSHATPNFPAGQPPVFPGVMTAPGQMPQNPNGMPWYISHPVYQLGLNHGRLMGTSPAPSIYPGPPSSATTTVVNDLSCPKKRIKPRGFWSEFENVERELRSFIVKMGNRIEAGRMPTQKELREGGASPSLKESFRLHGGTAAVAKKMGLHTAAKLICKDAPRKPRGFWQDFSNVESETHKVLDMLDVKGRMPTLCELKEHGLMSLNHAYYAHGGCELVAARMGLANARAAVAIEDENETPEGSSRPTARSGDSERPSESCERRDSQSAPQPTILARPAPNDPRMARPVPPHMMYPAPPQGWPMPPHMMPHMAVAQPAPGPGGMPGGPPGHPWGMGGGWSFGVPGVPPMAMPGRPAGAPQMAGVPLMGPGMAGTRWGVGAAKEDNGVPGEAETESAEAQPNGGKPAGTPASPAPGVAPGCKDAAEAVPAPSADREQ